MQHTKRSIKKSHTLRSLHFIHAIHNYFTGVHHSGTLLINIHAGRWCATNTNCRLAYWQVNKVNIVGKCFNRFPITKLWVFLKSSLGIREISHEIETMVQIPHPLRIGIKFPTPWKTLIIKFPPPWDNKGVKCPGYARGGDVEALIWPIH